jgi:tRNA A37 threonylcarbamoyladenosine synthetase subunit TsaC/SUA5/YrdC
VKEIFKDEVGYVFEGFAKGGVPSTIIDLTGKEVKIYREGNVKLSSILKVIEEEC